MSNILNLKGVKFFAIIVLAMAILATFGIVAAQTASADCSITTTLRVGSTGAEVQCLQGKVGVTADGKFGPMTAAAVKVYQTSKGLTADGVVGPVTRTSLNGAVSGLFPAGCTSASGFSITLPNTPCTPIVTTLPAGCQVGDLFNRNTGLSCTAVTTTLPAGCTSTAGYSPINAAKCDGTTTTTTTTAPLAGTDGTISSITTLSQYSDEEVGEGTTDVKVAGFELETSNDGDIALKSIKLVFDPTDNAANDSSKVTNYFKSVAIWQGTTKIGSADLADFSKNSDNTYSKVVTLSGSVVRSDTTEKFYITVDAATSFDSEDSNSDDWSVGVANIRYEDGAGVVTTDTTTATRSAAEIGWDSLGDGMEINAVPFATSADTNLKISTASDNPDEGIVIVSSTGTTDNVVLLKGKLKLEGTSGVVLDQFPVTFAAVTSNMNVVASDISLVLGTEKFSEAVPSIADTASASITFDNLKFAIDAGETVDFKIVAEIADSSDFTEGATLTASVTSTNRSAMDIENDEGDQLAAGEKSGTAGGKAQAFRTAGIQVTKVSTVATKSANDTNDLDTGTFVIKFTVKALGENVYVASVASPDGTMANAYTLTYGTTATTTDQSATFRNLTDADLSAEGMYLIEENETETFEMTILRNGSSQDGLYSAILTNIKWDTDDDSSPDITYSSNLDSFRTNDIDLD